MDEINESGWDAETEAAINEIIASTRGGYPGCGQEAREAARRAGLPTNFLVLSVDED